MAVPPPHRLHPAPAPRCRRVRRAVWVALSALVASACTSTARWSYLGGEAVAEQGVYEAVVRYVHAYYQPPSWNPTPEAWCLATDRRSSAAVREREGERRNPWSPAPRLLGALADLDPPVRAAEDCGRGDDGVERLRDGGGTAVLVSVSHPDWQSPERARVTVRTYQDRRASNRFVCRVDRGVEAWSVRDCL